MRFLGIGSVLLLVVSASLSCLSEGSSPASPVTSGYAAMSPIELFRRVVTTTAIPTASSTDYRLPDGSTARLSLDPVLQSGVRHYLEKKRPAYAVFVAVEPKTGRVLANTAYSSQLPSWEPHAPFDDYPMASLFKVVTAAAAFEAGRATADTSLHFRGGACSESPARWGRPGKSRDAGMKLSDAMAHSVNPAFGRLAADRLGNEPIQAAAARFGFLSHPFGGDFIASGKIHPPATDGELMRMAAGLDHKVTISPFHVAMLFAALGNNGIMPVPSFVDAVSDTTGSTCYSFNPSPLLTVTSPQVAAELLRSMATTVTTGTAKRAFKDEKGRRYRDELLVAGKTGSITGDNPRGHYHWFAGVAPASDPKIAFAALVVNGDILKVKAPQLAREALDLYFREGIGQKLQEAHYRASSPN